MIDHLQERIANLVPAATFGLLGTVLLADNSDGNGPVIQRWDAITLGREQPTEEELLAVSPLPLKWTPLVAELALPAYAGLTDEQAADALNARDKRGLVPLWEVDLYRVRNGLTIPLETAKASHVDLGVRGAAAAALAYLGSPHVSNIDMDDADAATMFGALTLGGVITSEQAAALNALADNRATRCEQLGLPAATAAIVALARG